jgi:hypothetical protein
MSDQTNAIQGNQSAKHDADTATRDDSKDNWQSWQARSIIAIVLLGLAGVIAYWDFGFFYKILIAGSVWWLVSAAKPQLSKSEEYKGAVWLWPTIVKGAAILMLFLTVLHSGFGQSTKRGVEALEGKAACIADSGSEACTDYIKAQAALDAPQVARDRQAERDQTVEDAITAQEVIAATAATQTNDVVDGCDQYRYDELARCWTVTLAPNTYFEHRLDPSIPTARCPLHTANHRDVVYTTPGTTGFNLENTGNAVHKFFVYEVFAGEIGPDQQVC